ncbi:glycosyltransferase [Aliivibrio fischeri]|uniref:glycosyltransferase family 4 protein n=1 Tax=Aliivibrio fischeri TaxID=668 RepID=UPI000907E4C9|nr:glycosyltransferase family 4 protein [Aliivibrio fischeri]MUK61339.1 glycosyltransferase [Aliivibrio fischeri]MUL19472.1 glycosyltransferase [Aliivibrio fischeri]MUL25028.1 glycosyltransferase [Aliivibrio fischeri]
MKIFQIITRADTVGGAQKHVLDISKELKKDGHQVTVISGSSCVFKTIVQQECIDYIGIDCLKREFSFFYDLKTIFYLFKLFFINRPDIIALHSIKAGLLGRIAGFFSTSTIYFTAHGWSHIRDSSGSKQKFYIKLEKYLSLLCSKVICVSQADLNFAHEVIGIAKNRLCLIENGVHSISSNTQFQHHSKDLISLLSIVRFQAPKDFETLLLGLVTIKNEPWLLNILGDGPDMNIVKQRIHELGLIEKINILGFKRNVDDYYQEADAVLLISKSEGLPMSLLEAMSCSKLLIASDVGGISDLIIPDWNGFLIPSGDSEYLSSCLTKLIDSPILFQEYGMNSKKHFDENYSFEKMYQKLVQLYIEK